MKRIIAWSSSLPLIRVTFSIVQASENVKYITTSSSTTLTIYTGVRHNFSGVEVHVLCLC